MGRMAQIPFERIAIAYRSLGVPTIPLCPPDHRGVSDSHVLKCQAPGKTPLIRGWQRYCSTLPNHYELDSWAVTWPFANVGGPTGPLLGIGLDVTHGTEETPPWMPISISTESPSRKRGHHSRVEGASTMFLPGPRASASGTLGKTVC